MKKLQRLCALCLSFVIVLTATSTGVFSGMTASAEEINFSDATDLNAYLKNESNQTTFGTGYPLMPTATVVDLPSGNYKVTSDEEIDVFFAVQSTAVVNICLNGYNLSTHGTYGSFTYNSMDCNIAGALNIYDVPSGGIDGQLSYAYPEAEQYATFLFVRSTGHITVYGGHITSDDTSTIHIDNGGKLSAFGGTIENTRFGTVIECNYSVEVILDNAKVIANHMSAIECGGYYTDIVNPEPSVITIRNNSYIYSNNDYSTFYAAKFNDGIITIENSTIESKCGSAFYAGRSYWSTGTTVTLSDVRLVADKEVGDEYDVDSVIFINYPAKLNIKGNVVFEKTNGADIYMDYDPEDETLVPISVTGALTNSSAISVYVDPLNDDELGYTINQVKVIDGFDTYMSGSDYKNYFSAYNYNGTVFISVDSNGIICQNNLYFTTNPTDEVRTGDVNKEDRTAEYQWYKQSVVNADNTTVDSGAEYVYGIYNKVSGLWEPQTGNTCYFRQVMKDAEKYYKITVTVPAGTYYSYLEPSLKASATGGQKLVTAAPATPLIFSYKPFTCKVQANSGGIWIDVDDDNNAKSGYCGSCSGGIYYPEYYENGFAVVAKVKNATQYRVVLDSDTVVFEGTPEEFADSGFAQVIGFNYKITAYEKNIVSGETTDTFGGTEAGYYILEAGIDTARNVSNAVYLSAKSSAIEIELLNVKSAAIADVTAEDVKSSAAAAEIASQAIADIRTAQDSSSVEIIRSAAILGIRAQLEKEALDAVKSAAIEEINSEAISSSAEMKEIVSGAIADVNAAKTLEAVETARSAAIVAIRAQLVAEAPKTADSTLWFVIAAAVAMLGCAVVAKKKFF